MEMGDREVDIAFSQARSLIGYELKRQRELLRNHVNLLDDLQRWVMDSRTEEEIEEDLHKTAEAADNYHLLLAEGFEKFQEDFAELESQIFDLLASRGRDAVIIAQREHLSDSVSVGRRAAQTEEADILTDQGFDLRQVSVLIEEFLAFLDLGAGKDPSVQECRVKLREATALQEELQSWWREIKDTADTREKCAAKDDLFEELARLEWVVAELRSLGRVAKTWSPTPAKVQQLKPTEKQVMEPAPHKNDESKTPQPKTDAQPDDGLNVMSAEVIAAFEEDYYRHVGLWHELKKTARTPAQENELRLFGAMLRRRREEMSEWRRSGSFGGEKPSLLSASFRGGLPGESHVRGAHTSTAVEQQRTGRSKQKPDEMSRILRDLFRVDSPPAQDSAPSGHPNRRVYLTSGLANPRTKRRRRVR